MKTNFRFLVATFISIVVASCEPTPFPNGGDPNNGDNSGNNGNTGENSSIVNPAIPYVAPEDRIVAREEFGNFEYFEYNDQGLLAKRTHYRVYDGEDEVVKMRINTTTYSNGTSGESIVEISKGYEDDIYLYKTEDKSNKRRTTSIMNASGRFVEMSHYRMENNGWDEYTEKLSYVSIYTYNTLGNLIGLVENDIINGYNDTYIYTWENGNPKTINYDGDETYNFSFRNEEYVWHGINIYWDLDATDMYGDVEITGRDGMKFANLLDRVYATDPETGETVNLEMVYTFDSKGRVKTVNSKWGEEGEEDYDEEDAVTFYYGDEELPEPPVVPAYLVKQEVVNTNIHMPRSDNDENTYVAIPNAFMTQFTVKNIFSDGTYSVSISTIENKNSFSMSDGVWGHISLTKAEFSELSSLDKPEYYVSLSSHSEDEWISDEYANLIVSYPHIGEIVCPITLNKFENPCYISLYDPSHTDANTSGYYRYYKSFFTEEFLLSKMKVSFELVKNNEDESWEFWTLLHHVDINLWPGLTYNDEATRFTWHVSMEVSKE